jgi:hypothetical protein
MISEDTLHSSGDVIKPVFTYVYTIPINREFGQYTTIPINRDPRASGVVLHVQAPKSRISHKIQITGHHLIRCGEKIPRKNLCQVISQVIFGTGYQLWMFPL